MTLLRSDSFLPLALALFVGACTDELSPPVTAETEAQFEVEHAQLDEPDFIAAWSARFAETELDAVAALPSQALAACNPTMPPECINVASNWTVKVRTADIEYAGTDAKVYFRVKYRKPTGATAWTSYIRLDNGRDNFERGHVDTFEVPRANYGTPIGVELWSDGSGNNPGWYPSKISIYDRCSGRGWAAAYAGWMNTDVFYDGYRDLACGL